MTRRDLAAGWNRNERSYGEWAPRVRATTLLYRTICDRCTRTMWPDSDAVIFHGAGRQVTYHPDCAKKLGIYPTS